jgi:hypothetical protein
VAVPIDEDTLDENFDIVTMEARSMTWRRSPTSHSSPNRLQLARARTRHTARSAIADQQKKAKVE